MSIESYRKDSAAWRKIFEAEKAGFDLHPQEFYVDLSKTDIPKLCELMKDHVCCFIFMKKNGEVRKAYGTNAFSMIPIDLWSVRMGEGENAMINTKFFDVIKGYWRSFRNENFIAIKDCWTLKEWEDQKSKILGGLRDR